jgi:hypothetical protein
LKKQASLLKIIIENPGVKRTYFINPDNPVEIEGPEKTTSAAFIGHSNEQDALNHVFYQ